MPRLFGRNRRGFNLLEVMIAAFLFSVVAVAFLGVWGQQVRGLEKSRHVLVATFLAEELIEESMAGGYPRAKLTKPGEEPETQEIIMATETRSPTNPDEWNEIPVTYTATREVYEHPDLDPSVNKVKQIIVKVKWEDTTKTGEVVLETFLAGAQ